MPITNAQKEFLEQFFGSEGTHSEYIKEFPLSIHLKMDYLEAAITQEPLRFLLSLDKLYFVFRENSPISEETNNLDFLRSLKLINDLYYNNEIKLGEYGTRPIHEQYLQSLGPIQNLDDIQQAIKEMVNARIAELSQIAFNEGMIPIPGAKDLLKDVIIRNVNPIFRAKLDLPHSQIVTPQTEAFFVKPPRYRITKKMLISYLEIYQSFTPERKAIIENISDTDPRLHHLDLCYRVLKRLDKADLFSPNFDTLSKLAWEGILQVSKGTAKLANVDHSLLTQENFELLIKNSNNMNQITEKIITERSSQLKNT